MSASWANLSEMRGPLPPLPANIREALEDAWRAGAEAERVRNANGGDLPAPLWGVNGRTMAMARAGEARDGSGQVDDGAVVARALRFHGV